MTPFSISSGFAGIISIPGIITMKMDEDGRVGCQLHSQFKIMNKDL